MQRGSSETDVVIIPLFNGETHEILQKYYWPILHSYAVWCVPGLDSFV